MNERKDYYKNIFNDYKEIDKRMIDIRMQMKYLDELSYYDDIAFIEELEEKVYKMNEAFFEMKQFTNKQIKEKVLNKE